MATNTIMQIVNPTAEYIRIARRPKRSMVLGRKSDPMANVVFMTAASSWDKNADSPIWPKIIVL
jgi:hypothetical protein